MRELIEKLERAEAGSRELDRDLAKLIDRAVWDKCANWASMPCGAPPDVIDRDALRWLPHYTTSLDAALALAERVLPGMCWHVGQNVHHKHWTAYALHVLPDGEVETVGLDSAATPALAMCVAVLNALRTTEQHSPAQQMKED